MDKSSGTAWAIVAGAVLCSLAAAPVISAPKKPEIETGSKAEVTADGLHRVKRTVLDAAWVKPDLDLTQYTKLMVANAGVSYRKLKDVSGPRARSETQFAVQEKNKARFEGILREEFTEELEKLERYEIVTEPGPDVLLMVGAVVDVVSRLPPDLDRMGRGGVYLESVGDATLIIELRDSLSNEVLVRAADRKAAESPFVFEANSVTVWSEVRQLAKHWARLLRKRLEEISTL